MTATAGSEKTRVLITGGAGYIGSHTARKFIDAGYEVVIFDNLSTGFKEAIPAEAIFVEGDIRDQDKVSETLAKYDIECVVHFASKLLVGESVVHPYMYYENNVVGSLMLLEACKKQNVNKIVFSSTAAVYGNGSEEMIIDESAPTSPLNPYGKSKLVIEGILNDAHIAYDLNYVILRYFNVAGASVDLKNGQRTRNATHLIKVGAGAALGFSEQLQVFGNDYNTSDGTCIRDYIHVEDLADIHVLAVKYLERDGESTVMNCGYGKGFSVLDVINTLKKISGHDFKVVISGRRPGDAEKLVADSTKARKLLGWTPKYDNLELICKTAYDWEMKFNQKKLTEKESAVQSVQL